MRRLGIQLGKGKVNTVTVISHHRGTTDRKTARVFGRPTGTLIMQTRCTASG